MKAPQNIQESSCSSFSTRRNSHQRPLEPQHLSAVEAAAAPVHAAVPTAAAAEAAPRACSLQGLRYCLAAAEAAATAALQVLAAFDALLPCLGVAKADRVFLSQPQQYPSQEPDKVAYSLRCSKDGRKLPTWTRNLSAQASAYENLPKK